jgi:glutamate decarboxylase
MGPFEVIYDGDPAKGIPCVSWKLKEGSDAPFSLYDLAERLRIRGWQVPAYSMPANRQDLVIQRILVRNGVSTDLVALLLKDFKQCLDYFAQHPVSSPASEEQAGGYHH